MSYDKVGWDLCNVVNQNLCHKQHVSIEYVLSNSFSQLKKKKTGKMIYTMARLHEMPKISPQYMYFLEE